MHPKRILVIGMTDNPGGIESLLLTIMSRIDPTQIQFDFIVNTNEVAYERNLLNRGSRIYRVTPRRSNRMRFYRDLTEIFNEHAGEYSAVWENANSLANIDYLLFAKRYGIRHRIVHGHNSKNSEGFVRGVLHGINRFRIRNVATRFWSVSDTASEWFFGSDYQKLPNYRVIHNAIDVTKFLFNSVQRDEVRKLLSIPSEARVVGNIGRLHSQKNQVLFLNVLAAMRNERDDIYGVVVGKGELEEDLKNLASSLGIVDKVRFVGAVDNPKPFYDAMDLFLFPSLFEGLGIVLLEAQANGLPCLVSDGIPSDALLNENVRVWPLDDELPWWTSAALDLIDEDRTEDNRIVGSVFDSTQMDDLFSFIDRD